MHTANVITSHFTMLPKFHHISFNSPYTIDAQSTTASTRSDRADIFYAGKYWKTTSLPCLSNAVASVKQQVSPLAVSMLKSSGTYNYRSAGFSLQARWWPGPQCDGRQLPRTGRQVWV